MNIEFFDYLIVNIGTSSNVMGVLAWFINRWNLVIMKFFYYLDADIGRVGML